jgi:hypothetical protein
VPLGARSLGKVENDERADWSEAWALFPGAVVYVWHAGIKAGIVQTSLEACGFETRAQIVWATAETSLLVVAVLCVLMADIGARSV